MNKILLTITLYLMASSSVYAGFENGSISGVINYCDRGSVAGMQVFIPGKSYVVVTGTDGKFLFSNVPAGDYNLGFMLNGYLLNSNKQVAVSSDKKTSLGMINVCGIVADQQNIAKETDSSDKTEQLIPAVYGVTDCSTAKEGALFLINNGKGTCQDGINIIRSCNTGFADCDEDISNGCEIDSNNDMEHCGSCFNACSELDSCNGGVC